MPADERSILITGCSSGIGRFAAETLPSRGWNVIASARRAEDVEALRAAGLSAVQLDVDDSDSIKAALDDTLNMTGGRLDALFNNAGVGYIGAVEDLSRDNLRAQFETNVFGMAELTNRVIPLMREQGYGRIVLNSSVLGFVALPFRGAYNASKHAMEALGDGWRLELHGTGIHVSLVQPGPILSRFRENAYKVFKSQIDTSNSPNQKRYEKMEQRLQMKGAVQAGTLGPEAVVKKLIHAIESPKPKARYHVTWPTTFMAVVKRVMPQSGLDWIYRKV